MQQANSEHIKMPWSYIVSADDAGTEIESLELSPNNDESKALAEYLSIDELKNLKVDLKLTRKQGGLVVHIKGKIEADINQTCVVSLEPIENHISEEFEAWYADPDQAISFKKALQQKEMQKQHGEAPITDEKDDPEPIIDGKIDVADVATQFLSLAIDPYPTKEGKVTSSEESERVIHSEKKNPFEALKVLKKDEGGKDE